MPKGERGFSPPVALILIGVLVVAATGYMLANSKSPSSETPTKITTDTKTETKAEVPKPSQDFPSPVSSILDKADMEKVEAAGMTIYRGDKPPNMDGK